MYTEELIKRISKKNEIDISKFDMKELVMGMEVELEHGSINSETDVTGDDPEATFKIVMAHMHEIPNYYTKLDKMEKNVNESENITEYAKRMRQLCGLEEADNKKQLTNESYKDRFEDGIVIYAKDMTGVVNEGIIDEGVFGDIIEKLKVKAKEIANKLDKDLVPSLIEKVEQTLGKPIEQMSMSDITMDNAKKLVSDSGVVAEEMSSTELGFRKAIKAISKLLMVGGGVAGIVGLYPGLAMVALVGVVALFIAMILGSVYKSKGYSHDMVSDKESSELGLDEGVIKETETEIVHEFEQKNVEPGEDDSLYNLNLNESENEDFDEMIDLDFI